MSDKKTYATRSENGYAIINGTKCSAYYCSSPDNDCAFPDCAVLGDEYESKEQLLREYPDTEFV